MILMNIWLSLLATTGLGALIGGGTNHLAIKMLFRPHQAKYIGKYRVPFTPGLIPKRRDELAVQLGKMVVDHLLTPEGIEKKLTDETFQREITEWVQTEVHKLLTKEESLREVLEQLKLEHLEEQTVKRIEHVLSEKIASLFETYGTQTWEDVLPVSVHEKIEEHIPNVSSFFVERAVQFFESVEGKQRLAKMIDEFFASRGALLNMVGMFLGNVSLVDRLQPEVIKFLKQDGTKQLLTDVMRKEWEKLKVRKVEEIEKFLSKEKVVTSITSAVKVEETVASFFNKSVEELCEPIRESIVNQLIPNAVKKGLSWISNNVEQLFKRIQLADMVEKEVATFSTERLEDLVLSITKSELKMITYLGALLGGSIGIVQGLLLLVIS
ncbi:DUF445 domain-containing protein [Bacillus manliponensis]|uniref:DUF445 domain-containing protein n=1 Tax=Bacillus manliponensis TaxID=574376 RepID=UPI003511E611